MFPFGYGRSWTNFGNYRAQVQLVRLFAYTVIINLLPNEEVNGYHKTLIRLTNWNHHSEFDVSYMAANRKESLIINSVLVENVADLIIG